MTMLAMRSFGTFDIRSEVIRLRLDHADVVAGMPDAELEAAYNGTGPEFLPAPVRAKLDAACRPFLPAVMVHDVDFTRSDGTVGSFVAANRRLLLNCLLCARASMPWYSWRRYVLVLEAFAIYRACHKLGWIAWLSAYRRTVAAPAPRP